MVELKGPRIRTFIQRPGAEYCAVLIHGSDEGLVRERAKAVVKKAAGSLDDPFSVTRLDDEALASDPGRLADEALAISLLGSRRVVWVRGAGSGTARALTGYLPHAQGDTLIVLEGGALKKTDKLRQLVEKAPNAAAIACYADSQADLRGLVEESLRQEGLSITTEALELFISLLGGDRQLSRMEVEKLCLFGKGRGELGVEDVAQISGDASALAIDNLLDAVFGGDLASVDQLLGRLLEAGVAPATLLISAANHINLLRRLRALMRSDSQASAIVSSTRPPIFFKRQSAIARQLTLWPLDALLAAGHAISECESRTRLMASLDVELVSRLLLTLSRSALSRRAR